MIYWRKLSPTEQDTHTPLATLRCILVTNTEPHFVMLDGQTVITSDR
jgi:hypothetical protein